MAPMRWLVPLVLLFAACGSAKAVPTTTDTPVPPVATATPDLCTRLMQELALSTTETAAQVITGELRHNHCLTALP